MAAAMVLATVGSSYRPVVHGQTQVAPVGQGFVLDAGDLRFIYQQILVAQDHAAGGTLLGPGPNQVNDPQMPRGLRTVDGSFNNLVPIPDQHTFGAADRMFPRLTTPVFRNAEPFDPDGSGPLPPAPTSYTQKSGIVADSQPRLISNLIVDQSAGNPAADAAAANPCGSGGFVCSGSSDPDPDSGALFIPNITPDFGLSAPYNLMFTFFGQFFDHGLDLVTKGGGTVIMPLAADDPLFVPGSPTNFMVMTRGQNQPGPDQILGTADDIQETINTTTPWVDQNQTYTSHPSHQVFLREYDLVAGRPSVNGKVLDGGFCAPRPTGIPGDAICNVGNWAEVKAQAASRLGIRLTDQDVFDVPLILTDPYGHFKPGPLGFPQLVLPGHVLLEGNPAANGGAGITIPPNALRTGHAFLNDIAHNAVPDAGLIPDPDTTTTDFRTGVQPTGTYDDELLAQHFITGDGRGNENIALTMVHQIFHSEHNRLVHYIDQRLAQVLTPAEVAAWQAVHPGSGWGYGERLFQAARFVTEMEYQHLVFEEFARTVQPLINPFLGGLTSIDPAITAEFAHTVYRLGHSMLPERVGRINADGSTNDLRLLTAFLNPLAYNDGGSAGPLDAAEAAGSLVRGLSQQIGNELDEFVTSSVRNTLVGLPLDLAAINIARGRSEGIPPLNEARRQFFTATHDTAVRPYANWFEFGLSLRHWDSLANFIAAYGTHPSVTSAATVTAKRAAAQALVTATDPFLFSSAATSGLDAVDFWMGGLAEKQAVFGGLLGSTFNFVFEKQLENLQDGDRFYYLQRTDGMNLKTQLEGNSFAELIRRNTDAPATMDVVFNTADFILEMSTLTGTAPVDLDVAGGIRLLTMADGTKLFFDPLHTGKNIVFNGTEGVDRMQADVGDDSMFGNGGSDRIAGGEGNDTLLGGEGNDLLFGDNGDDVIKGGPGHDAMNLGPGFGGDLAIAGEGNDFMVGGDDGVEYFGGGGNDFVMDGSMRSEAMFGGTGDDWIDDGDGHDGGMFGDEGNVFDLLAGLDPFGGDDVMGGGPGQDNHFGEGGDDIFVMSEGSNKFFGDFGFDWVTQRGWPAPADIELELLALPGQIINFNDLRNLYRFVDGASGWHFNDHIRGDLNTTDPAAPLERLLQPTMALTAAGAAKINGLTALMGPTGFNQPLPFLGGNILLGGGGDDLLEGKAGDDLIDGDRWLNVQLRATLNDGTVKLVNSPRELIDDIFADPQRLNPANIAIVRSIEVGIAGTDTAVYRGNRAEYNLTLNPNGSVTVDHVAPVGGNQLVTDGTDTLINVELLQFADGVFNAPGIRTVPNVVNQTQAAASQTLVAAGLSVGAITTVNSSTIAAGRVISSSPAAGAVAATGTSVALVVSLGPVLVQTPLVVGLTQTAAASAISTAGLTTAITTATSAVIPAGIVITQTPGAGTAVPIGGTVTITVSLGPPANAAPVAVNNTFTTAANVTLAVAAPGVLGNDTDADANPLTAQLVAGPAANPLAPAAATFALNANGAVSYAHGVGIAVGASPTPVTFTYRASDGIATSNAATVTINVTRPAGQPVANNDAVTTPQNTPVTSNVDANDTNGGAPGGALVQASLTVRRAPLNGTAVAITDGTGNRQVTYTPNAGFVGVDTYTYTIADTAATSNVATVTVTVTAPPATVAVPAVVNLTQAAAQAAITGAGLTVGAVTQATSATVPSGSVISSTPVAGTVVATGSAVALVVSTGPAVGVCTAAPAAPSGLSATVTGNIVSLSWTAPAGPASNAPTSYLIQAGATPGTTLGSLNTGSAATTFSQVVTPGTFFLRVRGVNACGTGAASNEVSVTIQ
jgi:beta-lactam-binding protein with PASTA domain